MTPEKLKPEKKFMRKECNETLFLMNIDVEILNKTLANQFQQSKEK